MLAYCGVEFVDKMFEMGESPEFDRSAWTSVQKLVGFESMSAVLPYLIDGQLRIAGANDVMKHIA